MTKFFNRLFNIQSYEWPRLLMLFTMYFLFMMGAIWGGTVVEASFLTQVGLEFLPVAFVLEAVVTVITIAIYTAFVDHIPNDKLLIGILAVGVIIITIGRLVLALGFTTIAFPVLYIFYLVIAGLFPLQWWNYIDEFYDTLTAKRAVPIIASALQLGTIFAGLTLPLLNALVRPDNVIFGWIFAMLAVIALIVYFPRLVDDEVAGNIQARTTERLSYWENIKQGTGYVRHSRFLLWMSANTLFLTIMVAMIGYQSNSILLNELRTTERLSNFVGALLSVINLIMLPIQVVIFSRIVSRIGVQNTNLIYPSGSVGIVASLVLLPGQILTGAFGVFNRTAFKRTFQVPVEILMYNTLPLRIKGRIGAVIAGAIQPLGTMIAGILLLSFLPFIAETWQLGILMGGVAIVYLLISIILRRQYTRALIETLEQEDFSFLLNQPKELNIVDATTVRELENKLAETDSEELTLFIGQLLVQVSPNDAVRILENYIRTHPSDRVRRSLAEIIVTSGVRTEKSGVMYLDLLQDNDPQIRRAAAEGIESLLTRDNIRYMNVALNLVNGDESLEVRAQVIPALINSGDIFYMGAAFQQLSHMLTSESPQTKIIAIRVLERINDVRMIRNLLDMLADPSDEVRLAAAVAVERMAPRASIPEWMHHSVEKVMGELLHDGVERIRQTAVTLAQDLDTSRAYGMVTVALSDESKLIRRHAVDVLAEGGKQVIPILQRHQNSHQKLAAVALARLNREDYLNDVLQSIRDDMDVIYRNQGYLAAIEPYVEHSGVAILKRMFEDEVNDLLDDMYYLLGSVYDKRAVDTISRHMGDADTRPFAAEALESMTLNPQITRLVTTLYEPQSYAQRFQSYGGTIPTIPELVHQFTAPDVDRWDRMVVTYMIGEIRTELDETFRAEILSRAQAEDDPGLKRAAQAAQLMIAGEPLFTIEEDTMLSSLEKVIFLKQVPLFHGLSVEELKRVAGICEEVVFEKDKELFHQGDPGDAMYIIVNGKLGIELENPESGKITRIAERVAYEFIGEMALFDKQPRSASVVAIQDTLTLRLEDDAFMRLTRRSPDLALAVIQVLSTRLRDSSQKIAELQRGTTRQMLNVYDRLGDLADET